MELEHLAANLRRLRVAQSLSQAQLAEQAGMSRAGYRNIEAGVSEPRVDTLIRVADVLGVGIEELLRPVRVLERVRFRADRRMTTRAELLAEVARRLDAYVDLETLLVSAKELSRKTSKLNAIRKRIHRKRAVGDRALSIARAARAAFGVGDDQIRDICGLFEDHGVKMITPEVASEGFFGLSVSDPKRGDAVVVNTWDRLSVERWIFTAAHELGHLILHQGAYDVSKSGEQQDEEQEADSFASEFLMPHATFVSEWIEARGLPLVDRVFKIKRIFKVSWKTVLYRIDHALPPHARGSVWAEFGAQCRERYGRAFGPTEEPEGARPSEFQDGRPATPASREPAHLTKFDFTKDRLNRYARLAYEKDLITLDRLAELLDLSLVEARALANAWVV